MIARLTAMFGGLALLLATVGPPSAAGGFDRSGEGAAGGIGTALRRCAGREEKFGDVLGRF